MNGILIVDKPEGFTSFDVVAVVRKLSGQKKIGHTGTLDPMATGVLPLLLGRAAKAADLLPDTSKRYLASFMLGRKTKTGDITGETIEEAPFSVTCEQFNEALHSFRGDIMQLPPMYSAVSVGGQRLYKLARQGIEIERSKRKVTIEQLRLHEFDEAAGRGILEVVCSKGTYIRTLIEDIAEALNTCGTMTDLRRIAACGFSEQDAVDIAQIRILSTDGRLQELLRPTDALFQDYRFVQISDAQAKRFCNGGALAADRLPIRTFYDGEIVRVYSRVPRFLGLGRYNAITHAIEILKLFWLGE